MLSEKDRLTDSLILQKYKTDAYNCAACEASNIQLMETFLGLLHDEHRIHNEISTEMMNRGLYPLKQANISDLNQIASRWSQEQQRLQSFGYQQQAYGVPGTYQQFQGGTTYQQTGGYQQQTYRPSQNNIQ